MRYHGNISAAMVGFRVACALFLYSMASVATLKAQGPTLPTKAIDLHLGLNALSTNTSIGALGTVSPSLWYVTVPPNSVSIDFIILPLSSGANTPIGYNVTPTFTTLAGSIFGTGLCTGCYYPFTSTFPAPSLDCSVRSAPLSTPSNIIGTINNTPADRITIPAIVTCLNPTSYLVLAMSTPSGAGNLSVAVFANVTDRFSYADPHPCQSSKSEHFSACSPTELNMNAVTLPISGTTALSNIIDTRGVKQATLLAQCTQNISAWNAALFDEFENNIFGAFSVNSPAAPGPNVVLHIGSESSQIPGIGSITLIALPQRAMAFSFTNATANAGTCTARLFLAY